MGRIKTKLIKRAAEDLFKKNKNMFKSSFTENKKLVDNISEIESKKIRNAIAGYLVRLTIRANKAS